MNPVITLVGRPNVGKSTLFNRLTRTRDALVADLPGLTRDRKYGDGKVGPCPYIIVDTGGISGFEEGLDAKMADQSLQAMEEADIVLFLVDAQAGLTHADRLIAERLRVQQKKCYLVVNKTDGFDEDVAASDFYELGLGESSPITIAASQNRGIQKLMELVLSPFVDDKEIDEEAVDEETEADKQGIKICVVGRPNVGKSTLVNRMLGEDRVVVYDQSGTTRDSIYIPYERDGKQYTLIDTAGVRRRKNISEVSEKFSIIKTLQAIKDSHVAVVVFDARDGVVEQDLHMLGFVLDSGKAVVLAINKWDGMSPEERADVKKELDRRLVFIDYAKSHFIAALHGTGVGDLYRSINRAYKSASAKWQTNYLTQILEDAVQDHQPPLVNNRRIKLRFAHQGGSVPPRIVVHGNQVDKLPGSYTRYLENTFRRVLKVEGTPIKFEFKMGENPYAGRRTKPKKKIAEDGKARRLRTPASKQRIKSERQKKKRKKER